MLTTTQQKNERIEILTVINQNPNHYLRKRSQKDYQEVITIEKKCYRVSGVMKGIAVWTEGNSYLYVWNRQSKQWE